MVPRMLQILFIASLVALPAGFSINKPRALIHRHAPAIGNWGFLLSGRDLQVQPGDDFYHYANGNNIRMMQIPADKTSLGPFDVLNDKAEGELRKILEASSQAGGKIGKLYTSYLNETRVEELSVAPLQPALQMVRSIRTKTDFIKLAGNSSRTFFDSPISVYISQDAGMPDSYCLGIDQAGLGLGDRDYYLESMNAPIKEAYQNYLAQLLQLIRWPEPSRTSRDVVKFEERIAEVHWSSSQMRDPVRSYNPMTISALKASAPGFDWDTLLEVSGPYPQGAKLVVGAVSAVSGIARIINETDISILRSWAAAHLVSNAAMKLSGAFVNASFAFAKIMSGAQQLTARWKRAVSWVSQEMSDEVGKEYVKLHFPPSSKTIVESLTVAVKNAFDARLRRLDWMTNATRQRALQKLRAFEIQVGYPKKWQDYSELHVDSGDLFGNTERLMSFSWNVLLSKLGKKFDRDYWGMGPQTVNAYNSPANNMVVFPAAILQPPFFDPNADMAVNFGGIGFVIGHEMTHGFDDQGRKFDASGRLDNWWTPQDEAEFKKRTSHYAKQFSVFTTGLPTGHHINSDLTMGENIADLGGITIALDAYHLYFKNSTPHKRSLRPPFVGTPSDGKEGDRRFFLACAQLWADKTRPEALIQQMATDEHPPSIARINIPMSNMDTWYEAFNISNGNMTRLPAKRVKIW